MHRSRSPSGGACDPLFGGKQIVQSTTRTAAWRLLTPFIVLALLASAVFVGQRVASAGEPSPAGGPGLSDFYINYAAPDIQRSTDGKEIKGKDGVFRPANKTALDQAQRGRSQVRVGQPEGGTSAGQARGQGDQGGQEPAPDQAGEGHAGGEAPDDPRRVQRDGQRRLHRARWFRSRSSRAARACPAPSRTGRCTTTSRTRRPTPTRTTTRSGSRTSRPSTSTRCSTPTRASPNACARI